MKRAYDYDVIVIGAGIAGMVSAVTANGLGKRVAVVEKQWSAATAPTYLHSQQGPDPSRSHQP